MGNLYNLYRWYLGIVDGKYPPKFFICKSLPYESSFSEVARIRKEILEGEKFSFQEQKDNFLERLRDQAYKMIEKCTFCEHKCGVNRKETTGFCGIGKDPVIASEFVHLGEESIVIPSHTIFFSGCNFRCVFCQNWDISQQIDGIYIPPDDLARIIEYRWRYNGTRNVNWVGGEPTPNIHYILDVLLNLNVPIPQIFNTNMYLSEEALEIVNCITDLWLPDFKYGNNRCAKRYSKVDRYFETVTRNLLKIKGEDILIRHLVLPNHLECCTEVVLRWISENLKNVGVNVMDQYWPAYKAYEYPEIARKLTREEFKKALEIAEKYNIRIVW